MPARILRADHRLAVKLRPLGLDVLREFANCSGSEPRPQPHRPSPPPSCWRTRVLGRLRCMAGSFPQSQARASHFLSGLTEPTKPPAPPCIQNTQRLSTHLHPPGQGSPSFSPSVKLLSFPTKRPNPTQL